MPYEFVTRDALKEIDQLHCEGADVHEDLWEICERLFSEREAYREVAIKIGHVYYSVISPLQGSEFVDAEAANIMSAKETRGK